MSIIYSSKRKYDELLSTNNNQDDYELDDDNSQAIKIVKYNIDDNDDEELNNTNNNILELSVKSNSKFVSPSTRLTKTSSTLNKNSLLSNINSNLILSNNVISPIKNNSILSPNKNIFASPNKNTLLSPNKNNTNLLSSSKSLELLKSPGKLNKQLIAAQAGIRSPEIKGMVSVLSTIPPSPLLNLKQNITNVSNNVNMSINKLVSKIGVKSEVIDTIIKSFNNVFHTTNTSNLLSELTDKKSQELDMFVLETQRKNIYNLLNVTISSMSPCSIMLSGPKHSGKTYTLKYVLNQLRNECNTDGKTGFITVELNGYLHNDEIVALKEIERQLAGETILKNRSKSVNSIVNSMEYLKLLLQETKQIFILYNFSLFLTPRQSLLYNLFDMVSTPGVSFAVVCEARGNPVAKLEKRIRSRANFKFVHFSQLSDSKSIAKALCTYISLVPKILPSNYNPDDAKFINNFCNSLSLSLSCKTIDAFFDAGSKFGRPFSYYVNLLLHAVGTILTKQAFIDENKWKNILSNYDQPKDYRNILNSCSILELALMMALSQLEKKDIITSTFTLCLDEIHRAKRSIKTSFYVDFTEASYFKAFESLISKRLVSYLADGGFNYIRAVRLGIEPMILMDFIKNTKDFNLFMYEWSKIYIAS